jgi:murein DD-endopeptidase MepM/ murein hydrolase activator NlpD
MACPTGTPILAAMSGKVTTTGINRVYGNYVIIDHGNGYQTLYAHMSKIIASKGQWVSQGTRIGLVGSTGYSTGPHLHFTVYKNGNTINPMSVLN